MQPQEITLFWLTEVGEKGWYDPPAGLDATIRERFLDVWQQAPTLTKDWASSAQGALASLILTDQFPRNMFRGDPRSFATDKLAREIAEDAIAAGFDLATEPPARQFFYMPFMHAEDLAMQDRAVALFTERSPGKNLRHARLHRDIIRKFGRFPFRNKALSRENTKAEQAFMDAGAYGAMMQGRLTLADQT